VAEIPLSDGTSLTVPDDVTDEQAQQYYEQAEAAIKAESDTGAALPVEDKPGWDWLRNNAPGFFQGARETVAGMAEGVGNLPNAIPNVVNKVNDLYHLHTDEEGTPPPEPVMDQWFEGAANPDKNALQQFLWGDKTVAEQLPPEEPGWEKYRDYGRMTGAASPAGPLAMLAIPAVSKLGSGVGAVGDYFNDPNAEGMNIYDYMMSDLPQGKWSQTAEFAAPFAVGGTIKGAASPKTAAVGNFVTNKVAGPATFATVLAKTGDLTDAYVAGKAAKSGLKNAGKITNAAMPYLKPIGESLLPDSMIDLPLGQAFARATARSSPAANEEQQRRRLFGGPR